MANNKQYLLFFGLILALLIAGFSVSSAQCGSERTSVKSLSDPAAAQIDFSKIISTTVSDLVSLSEEKGDVPRRGSESKVVKVHAILYRYGIESDGDYHLCIKDESGKKMIAEIPDPKCPEASHSGHAKEYSAARLKINTLGKATKKFKNCIQKIAITGVPMFDTHIHGQTGHADDDLEIHPVLLVEFE